MPQAAFPACCLITLSPSRRQPAQGSECL